MYEIGKSESEKLASARRTAVGSLLFSGACVVLNAAVIMVVAMVTKSLWPLTSGLLSAGLVMMSLMAVLAGLQTFLRAFLGVLRSAVLLRSINEAMR